MVMDHFSLTGVLLALLYLQSSLFLVSAQSTGTKCPVVPGAPGCVCQHENGLIDLRPISNTDGTPKYTGLKDPNEYIYTFNPCQPYTTASECSNVFICQQDKFTPDIYYDIADAGTEEIFTDIDGRIYLYYTSGFDRFVRIYLTCDESLTGAPTIKTDGDSQNLLHYIFHLSSAHACPGGAASGGEADIAGAIGLVLIFLCLGAVVAYFVIGAVIMKFKFQASGTDIIPNKAFWFVLPLLIKDGFMFTFGPLITLFNSKVRGYEKT